MKMKIRNTLMLLFISVAIFSQSAEVAPTEAQKLENAFEQESVNLMQLDAFEIRGAQKLSDLADYLEYISDDKINEAFRLQAKQLALDLFVTSDVAFKYCEAGKVIDTTIEKYLSYLLQQKEGKTQFEFLNIKKIGESVKNEDGNYTWLVQFVEKQNKDKVALSRAVVTINVSLQKVAKKFGTDTKWIWEVLLGEVVRLEITP